MQIFIAGTCANSDLPKYQDSFCSDYRKSGVTDHYALNDKDALQIARKIVGNLNFKTPAKAFYESNAVQEPIYDPEELYGIVGTNLKKTFDVREVWTYKFLFSNFDTYGSHDSHLCCAF